MNTDDDYCLAALAEAQHYQGRCAPNPAVGAVVVSNGIIVARGHHQGPGSDHAEVMALNQVEGDLSSMTLYVTLEPCCTHGRTPPCTALILQKKIGRVVYAHQDPNPEVRGQGAALLMRNAIACVHCPVEAVSAFYTAYDYWHQYHRPYVTAKLAISLDGKVAGVGGARVQITNDAVNQLTHAYRRENDAILTTANTVLNDDPQLNVRIGNVLESRRVYVLDRQQRLTGDERIFKTALSVVPIHAVGDEPLLDLRQVIKQIGEDGVQALWVEAGPTLFNAIANEKLAQRLLIYVAPLLLGPAATPAHLAETMFDAAASSWEVVGDNAICHLQAT